MDFDDDAEPSARRRGTGAGAGTDDGSARGTDFENTRPDTLAAEPESPFERTQRIPVERAPADGEYVRDGDEWIARCVARVLQLDPIIKADEARRSVSDLATLERWRLMKPEAAAEQLYTPIAPRSA